MNTQDSNEKNKNEVNQTEKKSKETKEKGLTLGGTTIMAGATTVQKWGNSLAVRIPKDVAEKVHIDQGSLMELRVETNEGTITLVPKKARKKYSLDELLSGITPENTHKEIDLGTEGNELI